jgi:hypothetical protein
MSTNLNAALKKDFAEFNKQLALLEKQKEAVDKQIDALHQAYDQVLDLLNYKRKSGGKAKRAKRGQSTALITSAIKNADAPLRAFEIIENIRKAGQVLSAASVRQQLPKLTKSNVLKKNKDKTYSLGKAAK